MTEKDLIQPYANTLAVGRTSETIDAVWMRNSRDSSTTEAIAPFLVYWTRKLAAKHTL